MMATLLELRPPPPGAAPHPIVLCLFNDRDLILQKARDLAPLRINMLKSHCTLIIKYMFRSFVLNSKQPKLEHNLK